MCVCKPASFHPGKNLLDWFRSSQNKSRQGESSRFAFPDQRSFGISVDMLSDKPLALASTLFELLTRLWLQAVTGQGLARDTVSMSVSPSQERFSNRVRAEKTLAVWMGTVSLTCKCRLYSLWRALNWSRPSSAAWVLQTSEFWGDLVPVGVGLQL